jgi:two-component system chemotaxis response regulator CheY
MSPLGTKILIVDDSLMIRKQVARVLSAAGYSVAEAVDGIAALAHLASTPDVRLVICDLNMPVMSGIEFLSTVTALDHQPDILMLTTEGQPALMRQARELGAKGWITKPFDQAMLVAAADKLTHTVRSGAA